MLQAIDTQAATLNLRGYIRAIRSAPLESLSLREAVAIAGTLGQPSKMPGYSYGLHAKLCRKGGEMGKVAGSVCAGCFAKKGFYATWRPAIIARDRRHAGLRDPRWISAMVRQIAHYCTPPEHHFRWHDSGDLQGTWHLANIAEVCRRTPFVMHWLPTREYADVGAYMRATEAVSLPLPDNLCIRLSALMIDSEPVIPAELAEFPTSTVHTPGVGRILTGKGAIECRAIELRDNVCGECRACWDRRVTNVSYPEH